MTTKRTETAFWQFSDGNISWHLREHAAAGPLTRPLLKLATVTPCDADDVLRLRGLRQFFTISPKRRSRT